MGLFDNIDIGEDGQDDERVCSYCGKTIAQGDEYLVVGDNFLQANYFDEPKENVFCCEECLMKSLSVMRVVDKEN